jgi:hypothetical protein
MRIPALMAAVKPAVPAEGVAATLGELGVPAK